MQKSHKLSIIIPCYNCATTLEEAVASIYIQKLSIPFEIVMVDDGSTDTTRKVMEKLATEHMEILLIFHEKNRGGGAARNTGIKNALGDLIFCLDSDNILAPGTFPKMISYLDEKRADGVAFYERRFFHGTDTTKFKSLFNTILNRGILLNDLFNESKTFLDNFLYTRGSYEKTKGYPEHHGFDTQSYEIQYLSAGNTVHIVPATVFYHRQAQKTKSYFERVYEQGLFSRNYYLIIEEILHLLYPATCESILNYDIYTHAALDDNLKSYLEQLCQKTPEKFFTQNYEYYMGKNGMAKFIKEHAQNSSPSNLFILAVNALKEKQYAEAVVYLTKLETLGYYGPIIVFNLARARLGASGLYNDLELPDIVEKLHPELRPLKQKAVFERNRPMLWAIRTKLKKVRAIQKALAGKRALKTRDGKIKRMFLLKDFFSDLKKYRAMKENNAFALPLEILKPCILDKTNNTPVDPVYFYQDSWCAKKVFENKPTHHYDIGSSAEMVGIISQFTPTTMVDIRPINLQMPGFSFQTGDILHLPFKDGELDSVSSICVIEHIGLGRYGDALDPYGSEKAIAELKRVLAKNGDLYISVPVDDRDKIYFNAHRAFTREYVLELFKGLELVEEKYIYTRSLSDWYDPSQGFGTGMFYFKKPAQ